MDLDKIDRAILEQLQRDGRIANVELARLVGLSESACLRRVRILEEKGVIDHYAARLNAKALGLSGNVFVRVSLDRQQEDQLDRFEAAVLDVKEVMDCYLMSGDVDYLIRVVVRDAEDYERVHNIITRLPGVARVHSSFALRTVLKRSGLPVTQGNII